MQDIGKSPTANNIRDIVSQVKNGLIDKSEAFSGLKEILQQSSSQRKNLNPYSGSSANYDNNISGKSYVEEDSVDLSSFGGARFTREDRRDIINKLIEKKKMKQSYSGINGIPSIYDDYSDNFSSGDRENYDNINVPQQRLKGPNNESVSSVHGSDQVVYEQGNAWSQSNSNMNSPGSPNHKRSQSPNFLRRSVDDSSTQPGLRNQRILQAEMAIRQEMFKDCTFRPQIKTLPTSYGAAVDNETPFYQRVTKWQKDKEQEAVRRKQLTDQSEVSDCTFRPRINKNSVKAVKEIRGGSQEPANERLYKNGELEKGERAKFIQQEIQMERAKDIEECTFQPQLATKDNPLFAEVKPVYLLAPEKRPALKQPPTTPKELVECTFTPKVLGPRPNMNAANLYLSSNVVDRLTRPVSAHQDQSQRAIDDSMRSFDVSYFGDRPVIDVASFMGSLQNRNQDLSGYRTPGSTKGRPQSAPRERTVSRDGEDSVKKSSNNLDNSIKFQSLLGRQEQFLIRKEKIVQEVARSTTPNFRPRLCRKSLDLSDRVNHGEFLERVERDVLRREDETLRRKSSVDAEMPFKPQINSKSEKLPSRTPHDMSSGDFLRKQQNEKVTKIKCDKETLGDATFQPEITAKAHKFSKSALNINDDSGKFLNWYREKQKKMDEKRVQVESDRITEELKECTFTPTTRDCPAYVKRIAKSMSIVKAAKSSDAIIAANTKPEWR